MTAEEIRFRLRALKIGADKYLGQHFLVDDNVLATIIAAARPLVDVETKIVEVGPGLGSLTTELLRLNAKAVVAVEKDPILAANLATKLGSPTNLKVISGDILRQLRDSSSQLRSELAGNVWVVVANIPYAITSPLVRLLLNLGHPPHQLLLMVQKEVAERICAPVGSRKRGLLTVEIEIMAESKIIAQVSKSSFWPVPKVESALLHLTLRKRSLVLPEEMTVLHRLVVAGFSAKRKQLINSLTGGLDMPVAEVRNILEKAAIDPSRRAETLSLNDWRRIAENLD